MAVAKDGFKDYSADLGSPADHAVTVTPGDDELEYVARAIWIAGAGDLHIVTAGGSEVTIPNAIGWIPVRTRKVLATGTTATGIVAVW